MTVNGKCALHDVVIEVIPSSGMLTQGGRLEHKMGMVPLGNLEACPLLHHVEKLKLQSNTSGTKKELHALKARSAWMQTATHILWSCLVRLHLA